ncbi:MAG: hypothetical protein GXP32_07995 [Kiritimatiellaeota bacterium]|nr:hypothetical protein [Kiritimatiellota bacterium]
MAGSTPWYRSEKTLSIHSINTAKRKIYYRIIILPAFALGTGAGDLISEKLELGYGVALSIFSAGILGISISYYYFKLNATCAFWIAFIFTRPLGASIRRFNDSITRRQRIGNGKCQCRFLFSDHWINYLFEC